MKRKSSILQEKLDLMILDPHCELNYSKDYELLIAVMLSAQCTDKRVNEVTSKLFKYSLDEIANMDINILEKMLYSLGTSSKKAMYTKRIAQKLLEDYNGKVPNDRKYLESLPGVGRKTVNVVLSEIYNEPLFAVDTHVQRVAGRLGIASLNDNPLTVENKLMDYFPKDKYNHLHHQLVLFGRYICKAKNPLCEKCLINCKNKKNL